MADGYEYAFQGDFPGGVVYVALDPDTFDGLLAEDFVDAAVPEDVDLGVGAYAGLHGFRGAEGIPAYDQVYFGADLGQVVGFFQRRIASSHYGDGLPPVEKSVAGGAGRYAEAFQTFFGGQSEPAGRGAGGYDQGLGFEGLFPVDLHAVCLALFPGECDAGDGAHADVGAETPGLLFHLAHQQVGIHAFGKAGEVFHFGGFGQLSAHLQSGVQYGGEVGAGGVDGGGVSGGAGADDEYFYAFYGVFHTWVVF